MLQAERALAAGRVDQAERLYWQAVEADRRNAIAVVGLARVALERGDRRLAYTFAVGALKIDPENEAARRLVERMAEVLAHQGEALPPDPQGPFVSPFGPTVEELAAGDPSEPTVASPEAVPDPPPGEVRPGSPPERKPPFRRLFRRDR